MNEQFIKDLNKSMSKNTIRQELPAGSPRRYEPTLGTRKHNERIHKESKYTDDHKNLSFTFGKPPKARGRSVCVRCDNCGHITFGTSVTVGVICKECKVFSSVTEVDCDR